MGRPVKENYKFSTQEIADIKKSIKIHGTNYGDVVEELFCGNENVDRKSIQKLVLRKHKRNKKKGSYK